MQFLFLKVATVSERSRIMELERDLSLRTREVADLQLRVGIQQSSDDSKPDLSPLLEEIKSLRDQLASQEAKWKEDVVKHKEKIEGQEKLHAEALAQLQAATMRLSSDKEQLEMRLSQAEKENADSVELWRSKLDSAVASHQQAMEELKVSLSKGSDAQTEELLETKSALEKLKKEHVSALDEAAAKHQAATSAWTQEMEQLKTQLFSLTEDKERLEETLRSSIEKVEEQHLVEMEDVLGKLHAAEIRVKELEEKDAILAQQTQDQDRETKEQKAEMMALRSQLEKSNQELEALKSRLEDVQNQGNNQANKVGSCKYHFQTCHSLSFIVLIIVNVFFCLSVCLHLWKVGEISSQLEEKQQEVLTLQQSLLTTKQKNETLEQEFEALVRFLVSCLELL